MKRALMLTMLLTIAFGAQSALAAPFAFGPDGFDDEWSLKVNLETLMQGTNGRVQEMQMDPSSFGTMYFSLMGVSQAAVDSAFAIYDGANNLVTSAATIGSDWGSFIEGNIGDYTVKYYGGPAGGVSLASLITVAYTFGDDTVYQPADGSPALVIEEGSFFFGLDLTGNGGIDVLIGFGYQPFNPVPVPAAAWLMGTGLAGLFALRRRAR